MTADDQYRVVLTPHPLQRVGAYALARLARVPHPDEVTPAGFQEATARMTEDAVPSGLLFRDSNHPDGFWLKCSRSFFPNSKMNHPSTGRKDDATIRADVQQWRERPDPASWPRAACVLCGRPAVKFFGKLDVPLAESDIYRNTTPRGHEGTALCWPCVCSFYALPYGSRLTGGPSVVVHSWDDRFLQRTVEQRVSRNGRILATGQDTMGKLVAREVVALQALRQYEGRQLDAGVDLLVFSNDNRGSSLDSYAIDQPLAEWLRKRVRGDGFGALVRAHRTDKVLGLVGLARNAFREPVRIVGSVARYLLRPAVDQGVTSPATRPLAELAYSYVKEVMAMDDKDLAEIRSTAGRVAALLSTAESGGKLNEFYARFRTPRRLRGWLHREAVTWALRPPDGVDGSAPLVTTRGYNLLFDPVVENQAWHHREILLVAVLEELHERGWRPADGQQVAAELAEDPDTLDEEEARVLDDRPEDREDAP